MRKDTRRTATTRRSSLTKYDNEATSNGSTRDSRTKTTLKNGGESEERYNREDKQEGEGLEECINTTTLLQRLLTMSLRYAPDFFKTITKQKRDDLRAQDFPEEQ
eukprot:334104-Amphidinium_carterae.1